MKNKKILCLAMTILTAAGMLSACSSSGDRDGGAEHVTTNTSTTEVNSGKDETSQTKEIGRAHV